MCHCAPINAVLEQGECQAGTFQMSHTPDVSGILLTDGRWWCLPGQKQEICEEVFQARGSQSWNYHTCKRLPAQSWGLEPLTAVCSSLLHLSTPRKHVLGGPTKHHPGQEEVPRVPPLCFSQVNRVRETWGGTGISVLRMNLPRMGSSTSRDPPCLPHVP